MDIGGPGLQVSCSSPWIPYQHKQGGSEMDVRGHRSTGHFGPFQSLENVLAARLSTSRRPLYFQLTTERR